MTTPSIYLALAIVLLAPYAIAQRAPTNVPRNGQVSHLPAIGPNVPGGTSLDFLAASPRHRLLADFQAGADTLRVNSTSNPFANGRFIPNGFQKRTSPALAKLSPQSQIYVIDTAIVRSLGSSFIFPPTPADTTRHLYSFNASAKKTSDLTQRLKGDIWVDTLRETSLYDASNNMISDLYEYWSNGQWMKSWRYTYAYRADGNQTSYLSESWSNGQWVNSERGTFIYDAQGNKLSELYELWSSGQWVNDGRGLFTYDAHRNMLSELYASWSNGQWVNSWGETYTYDANKNLTSDLTELFMNGQLQNAGRSTYSYDGQGNLLSRLSESYSSGQWSTSGRYTYTYDATGNGLSELTESWSNGQWVNSSRGSFSYDASGNRLVQLYESWSNSQWVNSDRGSFSYDASGNKLLELYESWSNGQWVNSERLTCTYDVQGNLTSIWHHVWVNSSWAPANTGWVSQRGARFTGAMTDSAGNFYSYTGYSFTFARKLIVSGVASESGNIAARYSLLQNYPNPFNPSTTIKYELPQSSEVRLSVYDMLGREVSVLVNERRNAGIHEVKFDGSNLASGVYFYRLQAGGFVQSKKIVLLR
jgi:hypothetical protein